MKLSPYRLKPPTAHQRRPTSGLLRDYMACAALDKNPRAVFSSRVYGPREVSNAGTESIANR